MSVAAHPTTARDAEVQRLRTLYQLLNTLSKARSLQDVYEAAMSALHDATFADRAAILIFDDDGVMRFKAARGISSEYQTAVTGHSPWPQGTRDACALVVPDVLADATLSDNRTVFEREGIRGVAFIPLALDGGVIGKFMLYYSEPHECRTEELEIAQAIAAHVALATEHKNAELARARSEQQLQGILDNSPAGIFLKDMEGRYLLVNRHYEELFRVSKTDVVGRTDDDIFAADVADQFRANDRAVIAAGKPLSIEEHASQPDGTHTYLSIKFPLQGPDGTALGVCGIATDITERKLLERAHQHLAAIVESSDDAIVSKDLNGIITSWNTGAERIFGYKAAEALGRPVSILAPPDNFGEMPEILSKIRQGNRVDHYETRRQRKDGQIIDVSLTVSPVRDASGQIVGASKIARDITDRKRAEEERASLLAREREARRTAELLNRVGPRLAAQLDLEKLVQEVTDIATALVGAEFGAFFRSVIGEKGESYTLQAVSGVNRETFAFRIPESADFSMPAFRGESIFRCEDASHDPQQGVSLPDCGFPPVRSYLWAPVSARSGETSGGLFFGDSAPGKFTEAHESIIRGIAAHASIAMENARLFEQGEWIRTELKRSNEELRRANRDLEAFAYSASHDLQEPLRNIAISAQLIEKSWGQQLEGEHAAFLDNILNASARMKALIDDLLAYTLATKREEGAAPRVDAAAVLKTVVEGLQASLDEAGAKISSDELPAVAIHPGRLAQVFQNLISNAIKYRSKESPHVHVRADERDGWTVFSVADNGIGIDPQFADQIFGLFKRLHGGEEYPGSGIGLAICQRVLEQYSGRIWLDQSAPGRGSTFCFAVPSRA